MTTVLDRGAALDVEGPADLEALAAFLSSEKAPATAMSLSELDGFLTGIAAGPELIMPSEWLVEVWGGEEPLFDSVKDAGKVIEPIMARYNEIIRGLLRDPPQVAPIPSRGPDGELSANAWCEGFGAAMTLRMSAWEPIMTTNAGMALMAILALCRGTDSRLLLEQGLGDDGDDPSVEELTDMVPACAAAVALYWRKRRERRGRRGGVVLESFGAGRRAKVGRNELCPCGSGAKVKKCCGAS